MTRLVPLPFRRVDRALRALGFQRMGQRGSHVHYHHADGRAISVPNHAREEIGGGLLRRIVKDAGVSVEQFLELA